VLEEAHSDGVRVSGTCQLTGQPIQIEVGLCRPLVKMDNMRRYLLTAPTRFIIFPYRIVDGGHAELLSPSELSAQYPDGWRYLGSHEELLRQREQGKMDHEGWYAFGRNQALTPIGQPKIVTPDYASSASFSWDETGQPCFNGGGAGGTASSPTSTRTIYTFLRCSMADCLT